MFNLQKKKKNYISKVEALSQLFRMYFPIDIKF